MDVVFRINVAIAIGLHAYTDTWLFQRDFFEESACYSQHETPSSNRSNVIFASSNNSVSDESGASVNPGRRMC